MGELPEIGREELAERLRALAPEPLSDAAVAALAVHYAELRRWNRRLALIGPGTAGEVLERHYGESLSALALVPAEPPGSGELVDLGSGAGFPGLVLAAARPRWRVTLVEARQRKWSFLSLVAAKAALSCRCLDARVGVPLPEGLPPRIDLLTARAVRLPPELLAAFFARFSSAGRALLWAGEDDPPRPPGCDVRTALRLAGSARRRIVALGPPARAASAAGGSEP